MGVEQTDYRPLTACKEQDPGSEIPIDIRICCRRAREPFRLHTSRRDRVRRTLATAGENKKRLVEEGAAGSVDPQWLCRRLDVCHISSAPNQEDGVMRFVIDALAARAPPHTSTPYASS